jgi:hypothetical protein
MPRPLALAALLVPLAACLDAPETGTLGEDIGGPSSPASAWQRLRTVVINMSSEGPGCTGTKIAAQFVLTAAHCNFHDGNIVNYYGTSAVGDGVPLSQTATVVHHFFPPGVDGTTWVGTDGMVDDLEILQLDRFDTYGEATTLSWRYPGPGVVGTKVGAGRHSEDPIVDGPNPFGLLLQVDDTTASSDDSGGDFFTQYIRVNHGDSGGPFFVGGRELGVASKFWPGYELRYTSVPEHLDWILSTIGYHWSGAPPIGRQYSGPAIEFMNGNTSERVCQYACDARSDCEAYDYAPQAQQCWLIGEVTGSLADGASHGALHYAGARASRTADVVGYLRSDGFDSIVHKGTDGHLHELFRGGTGWGEGDVSLATVNGVPPAPASALAAYVRADGRNAIVYRSGTGLVEVALMDAGWTWNWLPIIPGSTPTGDPAAYVRADGLSAVLYRTSYNHIIELSEVGTGNNPTGWLATDLTIAIYGAPLASSDPTAYVRSDGLSSVLFRSGDQIFELFMTPDHHWDWGEPSALAGAPPALSKPAGYSHHDGWNAIVYLTTSNRLEELWLDGYGWHAGDITGNAGTYYGDPVPYVRTDAVESVLHWSWSYGPGGQVWESANAPWAAYNLSAYGTGAVNTQPAPFLSHDGWNIIAIGGVNNHAGELFYGIGTSWGFTDLTKSTGEVP